MPTVNVLNMQGQNVGSLELSEAVFGSEVNVYAMHTVVRAILNAKRQGTQSALTRTEVRGGGRKIYRQKGTGNARHHGRRAPQFTHGGMVFAVKPRSYRMSVPRKIRRLAMKSALTCKVAENEMIVLDKIELADVKTKYIAQMLKALNVEKKALLVLDGKDTDVIRASKNIPTLKDAYVNTINVYDLLNAGKIIVLKAAMENIQEVYA